MPIFTTEASTNIYQERTKIEGKSRERDIKEDMGRIGVVVVEPLSPEMWIWMCLLH